MRSFVRRDGRVTDAQKRALAELGARYLVPAAAVEESAPAEWFGRDAPLVVEIGSGNGENLVAHAGHRPELNFLGFETYLSGVGAVLAAIDAAQLSNVRVVADDAVPAIERLAAGSISGWMIYFPDPWPKKRHHKRRLITPQFLNLLATKSREGASLSMATDWADYAEQIAQSIEAAGTWHWLNPTAPRLRPVSRPLTRYERRGIRAGHAISDFLLRYPG